MPFPTRVFEVSKSTFQSKDGRLVCGVLRSKEDLIQLSPPPQYCAVSYIWGSTSLLNIDSVSWGVPMTSGEKLVFMLEACRRIGYTYVWIDTLCIDQSSAEDKAREVVKMGEYYGNSAATIVFGEKYEVFAAQWAKIEPILSVWEEDQAGRSRQTLHTVWEGLGDINRVLIDGWFWRVWTLQEAVIPLASKTSQLLTSEGAIMRLNVLGQLIAWSIGALAVGQLDEECGETSYDWVHPRSGIVYTYHDSGGWCEILRELMAAMDYRRTKIHPLKILEITQDRGCTRPADRLRGAYGFVDEKWRVSDMEVRDELLKQSGLDESEALEMSFQILWKKSVEKYFDTGDCAPLLSMRITQFPSRTWDCTPYLPMQKPGGGAWDMGVWLRWRSLPAAAKEMWGHAHFPDGAIRNEVGRWTNPTARVSASGELTLRVSGLEKIGQVIDRSIGDGSGELFVLFNILQQFSAQFDISTILSLLRDAAHFTLRSLETAGEVDASLSKFRESREEMGLGDFIPLLEYHPNAFSSGLREVFAGWDRWVVTTGNGRAFLVWFPSTVQRLCTCSLIWVCPGYNRWAVIGEPVDSTEEKVRYRKVGIAFVNTTDHVLHDTEVTFV